MYKLSYRLDTRMHEQRSNTRLEQHLPNDKASHVVDGQNNFPTEDAKTVGLYSETLAAFQATVHASRTYQHQTVTIPQSNSEGRPGLHGLHVRLP